MASLMTHTQGLLCPLTTCPPLSLQESESGRASWAEAGAATEGHAFLVQRLGTGLEGGVQAEVGRELGCPKGSQGLGAGVSTQCTPRAQEAFFSPRDNTAKMSVHGFSPNSK